jgi:hypothetical protein
VRLALAVAWKVYVLLPVWVIDASMVKPFVTPARLAHTNPCEIVTGSRSSREMERAPGLQTTPQILCDRACG